MDAYLPSAADNFIELGPYFYDYTFANVGVQKVVDPTLNNTGILLCTALLYPSNVAGKFLSIYADKTQPTGATDATKRTVLMAGNGYPIALPIPVRIPPEFGIWLACNDTTNGSRAVLSWKLLQRGGTR